MEEKLQKRNKIIKIVSLVIFVVVIIGISYAYFFAEDKREKQDVTAGTLDLSFVETNILRLTNVIPIRDEDAESKATEINFTITNTGTVKMYTTINLVEVTLDDALKIENFKWALYENDVNIATGNFSSGNSSYILKNDLVIEKDKTKRYTVRIWVSDDDSDQSSLADATFSAKVTAKGSTSKQKFYNDRSGANEPELAFGMIPVVYNDTNDVWVVADINTEWYNYKKQMWANAVTVNKTASNCESSSTCIDGFEKHDRVFYEANPGTEISMDDINAMWVWIPRFKYNIPSNIGSSSNVTAPPQINVVFENGTGTTGVTETVYRNGISDGTNTNYYTHPAFRNVDNIKYDSSTTSRGAWDEEITGFWVGKFETSVDSSITEDKSSTCYSSKSETNCNTDNLTPVIKPDVESLVYQSVSNQFLTSLKFANGTMNTSTGAVTFSVDVDNIYGLNTKTNTADTHMMKNTEWGAVAILSQSQYGKMGNANYEGTNKEIYINNSYNSTNSEMYTGRSGGGSQSSSTYGTYSYNDKTCSTDTSVCTGAEVQYAGTGASTTGTIYGVYDMSGGAYEYTMGNWDNTLGTAGFTKLPATKYYDLYKGTSSSSITKEKAILGDVTYETMKWYSDSSYFINTNNPWSTLGGFTYSSSEAGVFALGHYSGILGSFYSFRTCLIQ